MRLTRRIRSSIGSETAAKLACPRTKQSAPGDRTPLCCPSSVRAADVMARFAMHLLVTCTGSGTALRSCAWRTSKAKELSSGIALRTVLSQLHTPVCTVRLAAAVAGGLSLAVYTLSHGLSANPDIAVNKAERESGELPADREERAQEYHDSALFAKKVRLCSSTKPAANPEPSVQLPRRKNSLLG